MIDGPRVTVACGVCGSDRARPERALNGYALVRCRRCAFVYVNPQPSPEALRREYADRDTATLVKLYATAMTPGRAAELDHVLDALEHRLPAKGRLLDFGCGAGYLVERALARGWDAHGLEYGDWARVAAEGRGVRTVRVGELAATFPPAHFDAVTAKQVLEHIPELKAELAHVRAALRPGGLLYADVPNYRCLSIVLGRDDFELNAPPQHLNYFTPRTLTRLLSGCGFDVLDVSTSGGLKWENLLGRPIRSQVADAYRGHAPAAAPPTRGGAKKLVMPVVRSLLYRRAKVGMTLSVVARRG